MGGQKLKIYLSILILSTHTNVVLVYPFSLVVFSYQSIRLTLKKTKVLLTSVPKHSLSTP